MDLKRDSKAIEDKGFCAVSQVMEIRPSTGNYLSFFRIIGQNLGLFQNLMLCALQGFDQRQKFCGYADLFAGFSFSSCCKTWLGSFRDL